jgi:hypothetical protein
VDQHVILLHRDLETAIAPVVPAGMLLLVMK